MCVLADNAQGASVVWELQLRSFLALLSAPAFVRTCVVLFCVLTGPGCPSGSCAHSLVSRLCITTTFCLVCVLLCLVPRVIVSTASRPITKQALSLGFQLHSWDPHSSWAPCWLPYTGKQLQVVGADVSAYTANADNSQFR